MYTDMLNAVAMNVYRLDLNWRAMTPPSGSDHCHQVRTLFRLGVLWVLPSAQASTSNS